MPKLTDTQLVILSAAAARDGGAALPLPKSLRIKGAAATKVLDGLLRKKFLDEKPAIPDSESWRADEEGRRRMLVISEAGLKTIDGAPADETRKAPARAEVPTRPPRSGGNTTAARRRKQVDAPAVRQGTKQALMIDLLKRKQGATIDEIVEATSWLPHSVRGAISGGLKKKLGLAVSSEKIDDRGRVYHITERA